MSVEFPSQLIFKGFEEFFFGSNKIPIIPELFEHDGIPLAPVVEGGGEIYNAYTVCALFERLSEATGVPINRLLKEFDLI